jgi:capsular polysaccharide biosynthesis protein
MNQTRSDLSTYLAVLRRYLWLIAVVTAATVGAAVVVTSLQRPVYRASMKIVVGQSNGLISPQFGNTIDPFTQTMSTLLKSEVVADTVIRDLNLSIKPQRLLGHLHVSTKPNSSVLEVHYDWSNRVVARRVLQDVGTVFTGLVRQKLRTKGEGTPPITATVFDDAHVQPNQVSPRPVRSVTIAGVLGIALGITLAFIAGGVDTRIRSRRDAEDWFGAPVIGTLPKGFRGRKAVALAGPGDGRIDERLVDALQLLRANL